MLAVTGLWILFVFGRSESSQSVWIPDVRSFLLFPLLHLEPYYPLLCSKLFLVSSTDLSLESWIKLCSPVHLSRMKCQLGSCVSIIENSVYCMCVKCKKDLICPIRSWQKNLCPQNSYSFSNHFEQWEECVWKFCYPLSPAFSLPLQVGLVWVCMTLKWKVGAYWLLYACLLWVEWILSVHQINI